MTPEESLRSLRGAILKMTAEKGIDPSFSPELSYYDIARWLCFAQRGAEFNVCGPDDALEICSDLDYKIPKITKDEFGITIHGNIEGLQVV